MGICAILFVGSLALRVALFQRGFGPIPGYVLTPARMDSLAVGGFLALLARGEGGLERAIPMARFLALLAALPLIWLAIRQGGPLRWTQMEMNTLGTTLLAVLFGSLLVLGVTGKERSPLRFALDNGVMRTLGKYSYALYLCHGPAKSVAVQIYDPTTGPILLGSALPRMLPFVLLSSVMSLAIASLSWNLMEKRILKLKDRFQ